MISFFKPYDPKRSCWVPIKEGGYVEGVIDSTEGDKVTVKVEKGERRVLRKDQVQQVNPPKFEKCEDMSNLTYLNEASVLHNLKARYYANLIYVSISITFFDPCSNAVLFSSDLLGSFLCRGQPVQKVSHLHRDSGQDVCQQTEKRGGSSHLCNCRWGLPKHVEP